MKKYLKKSLAIVLCTSAITVFLSACTSNDTSQNNSSVIQNSQSSQNSINLTSSEYSSQISVDEILNPLTGVPTDKNSVNSKPIAVMINNIEYAQPLMSISKADIIYECLVEGGITRLVAIYKDASDVGTIGSIRSARPPFIEIARGFQAVYFYCGTSTQAQDLLNTGVIENFDLGNYASWAWRDEERLNNGYSSEHTLVTDGKTLVNNSKINGVNMTVSYDYPQKFGDNSQVKNGMPATSITAKFSGYKSTSFKYDENEKVYIVSQFGEEMYDDTYDIHNTAENVFVLNVNSYLIDDEHVNLDIVGSGDGYYMNSGKAIKIKWSKSNSDSPIQYKTENGEELIMTPGRQYVCCIPLSESVNFS